MCSVKQYHILSHLSLPAEKGVSPSPIQNVSSFVCLFVCLLFNDIVPWGFYLHQLELFNMLFSLNIPCYTIKNVFFLFFLYFKWDPQKEKVFQHMSIYLHHQC